MDLGQEVTWEAFHWGIRWRMTSRVTELDCPTWFVDEMVRGPFVSFRHEHRFEEIDEGTRMQDLVEFQAASGLLRSVADRVAAKRLRRLLAVRNNLIRSSAELESGGGRS